MRYIQPEMIKFLDEKLKNNGLAQHAIETKDARTLFVLACQACVGIREKTGNNDGPMVELIQKTIGGASRESWCMSLQQTGLAYAEVKTGVKSPVSPSEHCLTVWNETPKEQRVKSIPLPGAIAIWRHGNTTNGHTGCTNGADSEIFHAIEGNTTSGSDDPNGKVVREGGGVYFTTRSMHPTGEMHLVGFLKPFPDAA